MSAVVNFLRDRKDSEVLRLELTASFRGLNVTREEPPPHVHTNYGAGVQHAAELPSIVYWPTHRGFEDSWSHLTSEAHSSLVVTPENTRPIDPAALRLLQHYPNDRSTQVLELGVGVGIAASAMRRALPEARLETVSLTPINPYLLWREENDIRARALVSPRFQVTVEGSLLNANFERHPRPFVDLQHIGLFPHNVLLPRAHYHFIYECYGPIYHHGGQYPNLLPFGRPEDTVREALHSLHPSGTLYAAYVTDELVGPFVKEVRALNDGSRILFLHGERQEGRSAIVMRGANPLRDREASGL